jgi:hypothetical protein
MSAGDVLTLAYFVTALLVIIFLFRYGKMPRTYVTDYMRGLRFVKGKFVEVLGPGSYKPLTRGELIEIVDMRPVPFVMESISYRDALQSESVVSIGAELLVDDPYLAATSLKHRIDDSLPIVRGTLRNTVSRAIADPNPELRVKSAEEIQMAVNGELHTFGMKITNVEITELFSRSVPRQRNVRSLN